MPGAGGVKATDFIANVAPKDGTVLGLTMPGALVDPLTGDPAKFRYIAGPPRLRGNDGQRNAAVHDLQVLEGQIGRDCTGRLPP